MSIRSSIDRSKDDLNDFEKKSYANIKLGIEILNLDEFVVSSIHDTHTRIKSREYIVDHAKTGIRIFNRLPDTVITVNQIRDIFDDMGFNVDVSFSEVHNSDIMLVYNIGGYLVPFYKEITDWISKWRPRLKLLLQTKLSHGKKRLHGRLYHYFDGSWILLTHVDAANWMNMINPAEMIRSHLVKGTGDYVMGTKIMIEAFNKMAILFEDRKPFFIDINQIYLDLSKK